MRKKIKASGIPPPSIRPSPSKQRRKLAREEENPLLSHLAASRGIGQRLYGDADEAVLEPLNPAQIDVLHRIMRFRQRELAARAIDLGLRHRGNQLFASPDIALHRGKASEQQLPGIIALHGVDIGVAGGRLFEGGAERLILGV